MNRHTPDDDLESVLDVFLQPGDIYWGRENTRLRTTLGSCVAIAIWHPLKHTGGLCHFVLPRGGGHARYADGAMEAFLGEISRTGQAPGEYTAKVFGGASMFSTPCLRGRQKHVGHANIEAAYSLLQQAGIPVVASDTGGMGYRKLVFELWNGHVWITQPDHPAQPG